MKILLVEDDKFLMKMYKKKFEISGHQVFEAENGELGLLAMRSFRPDVVLMDIMMPKMTGLQALDKIQIDPLLKDIPIIVLTNLSGTEDSHVAIKKGALDYIVKSDFTPEQVVSHVEGLLNRKHISK